MKIISWNVNGYRAVWKKNFPEWLRETNPDICCIQETKSWEEQLKAEQINPLGYHSQFSKPEKKGYSGVATFAKKHYKLLSKGYDIPRFDSEGRVIVSEHDDIVLANIYFPNGQRGPERLSYKLDFYEATMEYFERLRKLGKSVIVTGDYNTAHFPIDLARPDDNEKTSGFMPIERQWLDRWVEAGFVDIFRHFNGDSENYTWWDMRTRARERNIGWRIDYFFVSDDLVPRVKEAWIAAEVQGSDHCPVGIELE